MSYVVFDPKVNRPLHELPRKEAHDAYDWFLKNVPVRLQELTKVVKKYGIDLDFSEKSLLDLHAWFYDVAKEEHFLGNKAPSPELFSICNDIGIYIADILFRVLPNVKWDLFIADDRGLSYQRPVLIGFNVKNKDYHVDLDYLICQYAFRILNAGKKENDLFLTLYNRGLTLK
ncbi:hypothetical protein MNBD_GAMMA12-236 [hydrothermal vent metagenome]|uniref:Uncharacterized protein n=1 Tax=hydrothermal vent metagenome TaxID=652676 RepID=A0A3B0Y1M1_9ZZZZ